MSDVKLAWTLPWREKVGWNPTFCLPWPCGLSRAVCSGHSSCAFVVPACFQLSPNKLQVLCQGVFETKCLLFGDKKTHSWRASCLILTVSISSCFLPFVYYNILPREAKADWKCVKYRPQPICVIFHRQPSTVFGWKLGIPDEYHANSLSSFPSRPPFGCDVKSLYPTAYSQ